MAQEIRWVSLWDRGENQEGDKTVQGTLTTEGWGNRLVPEIIKPEA